VNLAERFLFCALALAGASGCGGARLSKVRPTEVVSVSRTQEGADPDVSVARLPQGNQATETCLNALDDNNNQIIDEGCNEPLGDVFFALAWDDPEAKLDLIVLDPAGDLAPLGRATAQGLVRPRDCPGSDRECRGGNYETALVEGEEPISGTFTVRVRFEGSVPPGRVVRAELGVRTPGHAVGYQLTFLRAGTELVLPVEVSTGVEGP
jgi:hypothetical protein